MHSGFATVVGRPNVGKSSLVNRMVGTKVSITAAQPNTTRLPVRGVVHGQDSQVVLVDTPGLHRPRSPLGERLNVTAERSLSGVDVAVVVLDATVRPGPGDRRVLTRTLAASSAPTGVLVAVNKIDRLRPSGVLEALVGASAAVDASAAPGSSQAEAVEYFPVSAVTGEGVDALLAAIVALMPEGPAFYPPEMVADMPASLEVAELVREKLLVRARDELPHSIACRVTEWEWPRVRCEILVERPSQKAIVIGRHGEVLDAVRRAVRDELPDGIRLELHVRVEKEWQRRDHMLDRLGY